MTTTQGSRAGVTAEGGRLVADALGSALLDLAEALRSPPAPAPADAPPTDPAPDAGEPAEGGAARALVALPTRAVAEATAAVAVAIVERLDVNALLRKVDVDELVGRIDVQRVLAQVDVDELVGRVDVGAVAREALEGIDIGDLIQDSTAGIASETMEAVRIQAMRADGFVARLVDRVLMRRRPRNTAIAGPLERRDR